MRPANKSIQISGKVFVFIRLAFQIMTNLENAGVIEKRMKARQTRVKIFLKQFVFQRGSPALDKTIKKPMNSLNTDRLIIT